MMPSRKKPGVAFWATVVLVALPLLYFASVGPMVRVSGYMGERWPDQWFHVYRVYMAPVNLIKERLPFPARRALNNYFRWWMPPPR
jgi:hypothetical protein